MVLEPAIHLHQSRQMERPQTRGLVSAPVGPGQKLPVSDVSCGTWHDLRRLHQCRLRQSRCRIYHGTR